MENLLRWVLAGVAPIAMMAWMTVGANASAWGQQLIAHTPSAYTHCTSGNNDSGQHVNHCFSTPGLDTAESGWWWQYGIDESWFDSGGSWMTNTSDWIPPNPFSDWYTVNGP